MQIGIDSFAAAISDPATGLTLSPVERMHHLLEEIELADRVGLDVFGIGEHHRAEFLDSAPVVILSAAATRTENIRLTSAVTVLSASDPVRVKNRSEEHTSELQSRGQLVCRLLLEKTKTYSNISMSILSDISAPQSDAS